MKHYTFAACILAAAAPAHADSLTVRGGISGDLATEYVYSSDDFQNPYKTDYGMGAEFAAIYSFANLWGHPLELGMSFGLLSGDGDTGAAAGGSCNINTYLGIISDCQDRATADNTTWYGELSAMTSFAIGGAGTEVLAGLGVLHINDDIDGAYLYPTGYENFVSRETTYNGAGIKLGLRHSFAMSNGGRINLEGIAGAYTGRRKVSIHDTETNSGSVTQIAESSESRTLGVYSIELRPSYQFAADWAGQGALMDVGLSYRHFFNVADTRDTTGKTTLGNEKDDLSAASIFVGLTIPLR